MNSGSIWRQLSSRPIAAQRSRLMQSSPISRPGALSLLLRPYSSNLPTRSCISPLPQQIQHLARPIQWRRTYIGSTQSNLAYIEQAANSSPTNPSLQNTFYSALLRANMPRIVVERYQNDRYAKNVATEESYQRALERLGQGVGQGDATAGIAPASQLSSSVSSAGLSDVQIKAIGQAMAAHSQGLNTQNFTTTTNEKGAPGSAESPIIIKLSESRSITFFRWVKWAIGFGFTAWLALMLLALFYEVTGLFRKVPGVSGNQAQAEHQKTRFSDVHGCDEAKDELVELVEFLKDPKKFSTLGGKLPKGVLLMGPPGTGKTLLARAVAGEAGVPFFYMSGSEFDEVYVGVGAKRLRELFAAARAKAPAIIFIDELDAVGGKRNERDAAYVKQTLNQLLTELDGFSQDTGVIVIGATNFPQLLDKALVRPGRFDRHVNVPLPDVRGRMAILKHHMKQIKAVPDVDSSMIARQTSGFSGAQLENLVNIAAVHASRNKQQQVTMTDFDWAKDRILMGAERRSAVIQEKDRLMTAYHEGGHALVAMLTEAADPVYKATIMPRGMALGVTHMMPEMDQVSLSKRQCLAHIDVKMGGKAAEEIVYGEDEVTTGASSDIQQATSIAHMMVTQAGFSDVVGNVALDEDYRFLSAHTRDLVEREVRRIIDESRERVRKLLTERRNDLETLAQALVEYEVLDLEEMQKVLRGEKLAKVGASGSSKGDGSSGLKLPDITLPPRPEPGGKPGKGVEGSVPARQTVPDEVEKKEGPKEGNDEEAKM